MIGWKPGGSFSHFTSDEVLAQAALPTFSNMTSASRLRYLSRFVTVGPDYLHALVEIASSLPTSWHNLVWSDIATLRKLTDGCPTADDDLFDFIRSSPPKWRSLVNRSFNVEARRHSMTVTTQRHLNNCFKALDVLGVDHLDDLCPVPLAPQQFRFPCPECGNMVVIRNAASHIAPLSMGGAVHPSGISMTTASAFGAARCSTLPSDYFATSGITTTKSASATSSAPTQSSTMGRL